MNRASQISLWVLSFLVILFTPISSYANTLISRTGTGTIFNTTGTYSYKGFIFLNSNITSNINDGTNLSSSSWATLSPSTNYYLRINAPLGTDCSSLGLEFYYQHSIGSFGGMGFNVSGISSGAYCDFTFKTIGGLPNYNLVFFFIYDYYGDAVDFSLTGDSSTSFSTYDNWSGIFIQHGTPAFEIRDTPFTPTVCTTDCNSSVLFLPGITGSRLYEDKTPATDPGCVADSTGVCTFKRWLTTLDSDVHKLYMDDNGNSVNSIYTKDVLGTALFISNIYDSFLSSLNSWKNTEHIIADYSAIPYDWRFSASEVVARGRKDSLGKISYSEDLGVNETPYILSELLRLSSTSRTGKVTIVAHSNGGLVAKELMLKLRNLGKEDLVDKMILVAVPEVGTPDGVKALLHGDDIGTLGLISDAKLTREFVHNMPTAYDLLPSRKYFEIGGVGSSVATFDDSTYFASTRAQYGLGISDFTEFKNYLKNIEGRPTPLYADLNHANTLNNILIDKSDTLHSRLDAWEPTSTTKVIEVAGWGEYTLGGIGYRTEKECAKKAYFGVSFIPVCVSYKDKQVLDITDTIEGDATVVAPSAHYLSDKNTPNTEKWWVDLKKYNDDHFISRKHPDILEVADLFTFIKNTLSNSNNINNYISQIKPITNKQVTKIQLNSPLSLDLYDSNGKHTGLDTQGNIEENIPGSRYRTIGESKYILVPNNINTSIKLKGYEEGSFSVNVSELNGDSITSKSTYSAIPSSVNTQVNINLPANINPTTVPISIDFNGDGIIDTSLIPNPEHETVYDLTPPELKIAFDILQKDAVISGIDILDANPSVTKVNKSLIIKDVSGNTTEIPLTKYREEGKSLKLSFTKVIRNGIIDDVPDTSINYEWNEKKGVLTDLDTKVKIKGVEKYIFEYKKSSNMTTIKLKTKTGITTTTKQGFVPVTVTTSVGDLNINY